MYEFLQPSPEPVIPELEAQEVVYAKNQPQYNPLRVLRSTEGVVLQRWTFTDEQRELIAAGGDVYLELSTFNGPLTPVRMAVGKDVDPDYIRMQFGLS